MGSTFKKVNKQLVARLVHERFGDHEVYGTNTSWCKLREVVLQEQCGVIRFDSYHDSSLERYIVAKTSNEENENSKAYIKSVYR